MSHEAEALQGLHGSHAAGRGGWGGRFLVPYHLLARPGPKAAQDWAFLLVVRFPGLATATKPLRFTGDLDRPFRGSVEAGLAGLLGLALRSARL